MFCMRRNLVFIIKKIKNFIDPINNQNIRRLKRIIRPGCIVLDYGSGRSQYKDVVMSLDASYCAYEPHGISPRDDRELFLASRCTHKVILLFEVLQHVKDVDEILSDIIELMDDQTQLIITYPFLFPTCERKDFHRWTSGGFDDLLTRHSLKILQRSFRGGVFSCSIECFRMYLINAKWLEVDGWFHKRLTYKWWIRLLIEVIFLLPRFTCYNIDRILPNNGVYVGEIIEVIVDNDLSSY
jgi:hypothetical protein